MPIVINNLGGDPLGISEYEVCIGDRRVALFNHDRTKGLTDCLRAAMEAVNRQQWQEQAGKWYRLPETEKP